VFSCLLSIVTLYTESWNYAATGTPDSVVIRREEITAEFLGSMTRLCRFTTLLNINIAQWRMQDFDKGDAEQEVWGTEVPQQGPGAEPRWGSGGEAPRSQKAQRKFCA